MTTSNFLNFGQLLFNTRSAIERRRCTILQSDLKSLQHYQAIGGRRLLWMNIQISWTGSKRREPCIRKDEQSKKVRKYLEKRSRKNVVTCTANWPTAPVPPKTTIHSAFSGALRPPSGSSSPVPAKRQRHEVCTRLLVLAVWRGPN